MTDNRGVVVVVSGVFDHAGDNLISLRPVRRYPWRSSTIPDQKEGRYLLRVRYVNGEETVVPFDALVADDSGRTRHGFFELTVPLKDEIESLSITDSTGRKRFALVEASEIQP